MPIIYIHTYIVYTCMCIYNYTYMHFCMLPCILTCMNAYMLLFIHSCIHICIHTCSVLDGAAEQQLHEYTYTCIHTYICMNINQMSSTSAGKYTCIYTRIHENKPNGVYIHTYAHIQMRICIITWHPCIHKYAVCYRLLLWPCSCSMHSVCGWKEAYQRSGRDRVSFMY